MPSYTIYGDNTDGSVECAATSWAGCQTRSGSISSDSTNQVIFAGRETSTPSYMYWQGGLAFDTSVIPTAAVVVSAVLSLYPAATKTLSQVLEIRDFDWGSGLSGTDYKTSAQWSAATLLASYALTGGWVATGYKVIPAYGSNLAAAINKDAMTRFMVGGNDFGGIAAPDNTDLTAGFYAANDTGTTRDPKLEITTSEAPDFTPTVSWIT